MSKPKLPLVYSPNGFVLLGQLAHWLHLGFMLEPVLLFLLVSNFFSFPQDAAGQSNLYEMQASWYEIALARAYRKAGDLPNAITQYGNVIKVTCPSFLLSVA